jgi:Na+/proline symporter/signal transduction histidine kinase
MFEGWLIIAVALGYVSALFAVAWLGDRLVGPAKAGDGRPLTYALSLAVYCTSWTFFGSVGRAASTGWDFVPVYIGPVLMFALGWPLVLRIVRLAKGQNLTSVSDFLAARYGKSQSVAAVVTLVAVVGTLPYIALQLKAVAVSIETLLGGNPLVPIELPTVGFLETAFVITLMLALFAILFGTRHIDATEHQDGLMLAVAAESLVKLAAFLAVGIFVVFWMFGGIAEFMANARVSPHVQSIFGQSFNGSTWLTVTMLSFVCIILLPRQFHVTVVENHSEREVRRAAWLFPAYLVLINLFVVPIAAAGIMVLPAGLADPDFYVLGLPMGAGYKTLSLVAFIGGLSAATAMVVVESVALAIMICNGLVVPWLLNNDIGEPEQQQNMTGLLLLIRRVAIVMIMLGGYAVYRALGQSQELVSIGLVSFAAIAQLAPAFFLGLMWRRATARGAIAGMAVGSAVWVYTLLVPWIAKAGWLSPELISEGPFSIAMLKPQALFFMQFEPLTHGVLFSLGANLAALFIVSILRAPEPVERLQAHIFVQDDVPPAPLPASSFRIWRSSITVHDLQTTVARYLGAERAERSFADYAAGRNGPLPPHAEADIQTVRFTEHLLTSAIGAASARLVLSLLLRRSNVGSPSALKLLDDASEALQYNRDLLQSALDQVRHGLSVFDKELRLVCWNRQFRELLDLPAEVGRVGVPLDQILRLCAERGDFGPGPVDTHVADRLMKLAVKNETFLEHIGGRRILEIRTSPMPQGGFVTTYSDITERVAAATALAQSNETLERRVKERTAELTEVNDALAVAKQKADAANLDKTRFIAAASHDILQPLNAARLYTTSLAERQLAASDAALARNIDASLSAVEEIFSTLIDISRLDAGRLEPEISDFALGDIFEQLKVEFTPMAGERGLTLKVVGTREWVRSDRRLLRRLLQNLVSNGIKYTRTGKVLLGARRRGAEIVVMVVDTGPGIPRDKQEQIFKEFQRLDDTAASVRGLGLGLSIVERIGRVLGTPVSLSSQLSRGSAFSVTVPRAIARAAPQTQPSAPAVPAGVAGSLAGVTALCVDNEPAVLDGMATLLRGWGCEVLTANDLAGALAHVAGGKRPDVILADYHLDQGVGLDIVAGVRQATGRHIPAVIITADQTPEVQRNIKLQDAGLLRKPLKAAALRAMLGQYTLRRMAAE